MRYRICLTRNLAQAAAALGQRDAVAEPFEPFDEAFGLVCGVAGDEVVAAPARVRKADRTLKATAGGFSIRRNRDDDVRTVR